MRVTAIDQVELTGTLTELSVTWVGAPARRGLPVGFNQGNHLRAQRSGRGAWLAGRVTLPDVHPDPSRVAGAVARLLGEHDALRASFTVSVVPTQDVFDATQLQVRPRVVGRVWHGFVESLLTQRCRAGDVPGVFFGILDDTVICAFDHAHADAITIDLVLRRLCEYYIDPTTPRRPTLSYADRCLIDAAEASSPNRCDDADSTRLMQVWHDFFTLTEGAVPAFPLCLGAGRAPQRTVDIPLLAQSECAELLSDSSFATILSALAAAVVDVGGPERLATLIPIHTRGPRTSGWHSTAGWLVSNAPVVVNAGDPNSAATWLRHASELAGLPLDHVLAQCRPHLPTEDIFMVSYLDYRKFGPALPGGQHISAVTSTDTAQFWFTRSDNGLELRVRHPARPVADDVIAGLLTALHSRLREPRPLAVPAP